MRLSGEQIAFYEENGYLLLPSLFDEGEMAVVRRRLDTLLTEESAGRVREKDSQAVRALHGTHETDELFSRLVRDPRLLGPGQQLVDDPVYVYQFKINAKVAFEGDVWEWHQDYIFWREEDGLEECRAVNVTLFLDPVTEFNGPLIFIPGSHRHGVLEPNRDTDKPAGYEDEPDWISNLTADIKYSIDRETLQRLTRERGMVAPKGPAGSVLVFHPNLIHGSVPNISPFDRALMLVTYNSVENLPTRLDAPDARPEFLVSRNFAPLEPLPVRAPSAVG